MQLRKSVSDYLPKAVVASTIFTLYNTYTGDITNLVTIGVEFVSYVIAIFLGFLIITPVLEKVFNI